MKINRRNFVRGLATTLSAIFLPKRGSASEVPPLEADVTNELQTPLIENLLHDDSAKSVPSNCQWVFDTLCPFSFGIDTRENCFWRGHSRCPVAGGMMAYWDDEALVEDILYGGSIKSAPVVGPFYGISPITKSSLTEEEKCLS